MKRATAFLMCMLMVGLASVPVLAQEEGDYRTRASGDWSMAQHWERYNGASWAAVATPPDGSETITVMAEDSIYVNSDVTITGRLINQGIIGEDGALTIGDGGVYQHDRDEGSIPMATWDEGSTIHITGVTATAPANRNQSYHHVVFETPGLLSNLNMQLDDATIGGDIRVLDTGFARWYLTSTDPNDTSHVTLMGDVILDAAEAINAGRQANFAVHGTSNAATTFIVDHYGDVIVDGGNFSISRGSQGLGTTTWNLHEGNFSMQNATTQNSTITPGGARFIFRSGGTQNLMLGEGNSISSLPIVVAEGTTLDAGSSVLDGSGDFVVREGATLGTALPGGVAAMFAGTYVGADTLETNSSFLFNGTSAQVTSESMPATVTDLTINNPEGVTLSQETTINGVLRLQAGVFDNSIPFTLGAEGSIVEEGGSLLHAVSAEDDDVLPRSFFVDQNYPNPFNPSTTIRFGLPAHSDVSIKIYNMLGQQVSTLLEGSMTAGVHEVAVDMSGLSSGIYLYRIQSDAGDMTRQMVLMK